MLLGIRPVVWMILAIGAAVPGAALWWSSAVNERAEAYRTRSAETPDHRPGTTASAEPMAGRGHPGSPDAPAFRSSALRPDERTRATGTATSGAGGHVRGSGAPPSRMGSGDRGATAARAATADPRELERSVAELAQNLDLPLLRTGGRPEPPADAEGERGGEVDDGSADSRVRDAANAALTEYLLRQELWGRSSGRLLPFGYPVNALRSEIGARVEAMDTQQRNDLLAEAERYLPAQKRPIMSLSNDYTGRDGSSSPEGVDFYDPYAE